MLVLYYAILLCPYNYGSATIQSTNVVNVFFLSFNIKALILTANKSKVVTLSHPLCT